MTTLKGKLANRKAPRFLMILAIMFVTNSALAQLDSVSVSGISFSQEYVTDSIANTTDTLDIMAVDVFIDDIDFMGEVLVTVYDLNNDFPLSAVKHTKAELQSFNLINGSVAKLELLGLGSVMNSYKIDVQVRNLQGGNLPIVSTQY